MNLPVPQTPVVLKQEVATTLTFGAIADAYVSQSADAANFGGADSLRVDLSPEEWSYLRFDVTGVTGTVTRATLRLYVTNGGVSGPRVFSSQPEWTEDGITFRNHPGTSGGVLDAGGAISSGSWVEYNVTSAVRGNGTLHFTLVGTSNDSVSFASSENSREDRRPQLVLTVASEPDCMPRTATSIFDPQATYDAYASQSQPTRRFGSEPRLLVDSAPDRLETFLQFRYGSSDEWRVRQAKLRLYATDASPDGPLLYRASDDWPASGSQDFDWNTRPALIGAPVGNLGAIEANTWVEYDVSSLVTTTHGIYSFGLVPESTNGVDFVSADSPSYELRPRLSITLESQPYCSYRGTGGGSTGWTRHYGGAGIEKLLAMATDTYGNFVAAGLFGDAPFPNGKGFALARYAADGTPVWTRQVTTEDLLVRALSVTRDGTLFVVGRYRGSPDLGTGPLPDSGRWSNAFFIAKFSPTGQTEWARGFAATYLRPSEGTLEHWPVTPEAVTVDALGNGLTVVGTFYGEVDFGGGTLFAGLASVYNEDPFPGGFVVRFTNEGQHVWSRALEAKPSQDPTRIRAVALDTEGNALIGGRVNKDNDLGDGPVASAGAFIAKYSASGALQWKRLFPGVFGEINTLRYKQPRFVYFAANLGGSFTFGGRTYTGGDPDDLYYADNVSGFFGSMENLTGTDQWLRQPGLVTLQGLLVADNFLTVTGKGLTYDLGGGTLGGPIPSPFVASYTETGAHRWSRSFDPDIGDAFGQPQLILVPQAWGQVLVGGTFSTPIQHDGTTYTPRGNSDLLYFQLKP
ncbi:DNRLRE domain-containing protein [Archangium violaceum]|uniref:CBM96 family carbohydrate-binding protein n=1 Tax=Archangium violaceum TaxID=83451 RepID=UPI0019526694|nr:DNRLRE domain-containing protein [Archangium violaceum]QRN98763.1 DNRLRE domain-containing protein [Archangium violaceum]